MATLEIDGRQITVENGTNLVEAAERLGIEIPHYCYHPALSVAGNCRMCLVEIEKVPKLQIACNTQVRDGMVVHTCNDRVKQVRAAVLEFLLINHPIDCPICDQAGECKLQDYYMDYDRRSSRVPREEKVRKGKAIDIGPLVMLDQERCILCTRCVRFLDEVTHTSELNIFQRGDRSRIELFPGQRLDNPYSGNVVDICPVGALTNKAFRFRSRVWYLDRTPSVCPTCATGCNIDVYHRGREMFRFRPRHNAEVNGYWMCDEGRLSLSRFQGEGRLLRPVVRDDGGWVVRQWDEILPEVVTRVRALVEECGADAVCGIASAQATTEEMFLFRRVVEEALGGRVAGVCWSDAEAFHDDRLIDADRNPNSAGLRAFGLDPAAGGLGKVAGGKDPAVLFLLRPNAEEAGAGDELAAIAAAARYVVVLDTHHRPSVDSAHVLLPIASFAETDGTFVNRTGRVQRIRAAFDPVGQARPGWKVLSELAAHLGVGEEAVNAAAVFTELGAEVPAFARQSYDSLGTGGAPLAVVPGA